MNILKMVLAMALMVCFTTITLAATPEKPVNYKEIIFDALKVKKTDGVDKQEALLLAQKYLIDQGYEKAQDISAGKVLKFNKADKSWLVSFPPKDKKGRKRHVWVPAEDGVITNSVLK